LFQEFILEFKHKKGVENVVADHLSRIKSDELELYDRFPDENLYSISDEPWYAPIANYLPSDYISPTWTKADKEKIKNQSRH
ncbi:hypothetical protein ABFV55_27860, partial [Pseudomonas syringae]|uniref:hypothetical protein n=1 Tax=Pseudomonas syringae TaxID=317 RepID=UPI0034D9599B